MVQVIWPCGNVEFTDGGNCISQLDRGDWDFQRRERGSGERERRLELEHSSGGRESRTGTIFGWFVMQTACNY